jgi:hypothetical protein
MTDRPKKLDLLKSIQAKISSGKVRYSAHANERMLERGIIKPEVEYVLKAGHHNKKKDQFNETEKEWDYAIEGKTVDGKKLRIVVTLVDPNLLVVTAIDLDAGD